MKRTTIFFVLASCLWAQLRRSHVVLISVDGFAAYHLQDKDWTD